MIISLEIKGKKQKNHCNPKEIAAHIGSDKNKNGIHYAYKYIW